MDHPIRHGGLGVASTFHAIDQTLAADDSSSPASGLTLDPASDADRYRSKAVLGEGGMGRVTHVWDADLMRDLALKELIEERRGSPQMLRQFLWEARVTAYLDHPNIVPLHDLGLSDDSGPWFTMKLVRGRSLRAALDELEDAPPDGRRLSPSRRLRLFLQLCDAIAFAHDRGVLHRDLKPDNVMLGEHGELLVMDWGIAVPLDGPAGEAIAAGAPPGLHPFDRKKLSGTPRYMSPEQARGKPLDVRSDVYTLGVILYELVSLRAPCGGRTVPEVLMKIASGAIVPITEACPEVAPSLAAVIERAMAHRPDDRYPTVAALREDVETVIDGGTPRAEQASLHQRVGRFYLRDRNPLLRYTTMLDLELMMGSTALFGASMALLITAGVNGWMLGTLACAIVVFAIVMLGMRRRRHRRAGASS